MSTDTLKPPVEAAPRGVVKGWIIIVIAALLSWGLYQILP